MAAPAGTAHATTLVPLPVKQNAAQCCAQARSHYAYLCPVELPWRSKAVQLEVVVWRPLWRQAAQPGWCPKGGRNRLSSQYNDRRSPPTGLPSAPEHQSGRLPDGAKAVQCPDAASSTWHQPPLELALIAPHPRPSHASKKSQSVPRRFLPVARGSQSTCSPGHATDVGQVSTCPIGFVIGTGERNGQQRH